MTTTDRRAERRLSADVERRDIAKSMSLPFTLPEARRIVEAFPTPVFVFDEAGIRGSAQRLNRAFSWVVQPKIAEPNVRRPFNFFAGKAEPTKGIQQIVVDEGMGLDCSSYPELILAQQVGLRGEQIMFTSNNTPAREYQKAMELGAIVNLDHIGHITFLERHAGLPSLISLRYNPGPLRGGNDLIGNPEESKFGMTKDQLFQAYDVLRGKGVRRFGLHTMLASNELNAQYFVDTANMAFDLVGELSERGIQIEFVNLGGGIGIPYRPEEDPVDLEAVSQGIRAAYQRKIVDKKLGPVGINMETGRLITGPHGYLLTTARHFKDTYRDYIGVDANVSADLLRAAMYPSAYHHITVLGMEDAPRDFVADVVDGLCENNGKFAKQRHLPSGITDSSILVVHDVGAHAAAMGNNYNGKLRSEKVVLGVDRSVRRVMRAETVEDYFATQVFTAKSIHI